MMKIILRFLFGISFLISCKSQVLSPDDLNLNGSVEKLTVNRFKADEYSEKRTRGAKAEQGHSISMLNEEGTVLEMHILDVGGQVITKYVNIYDSGTLARTDYFDGKGNITQTSTCTSKNGRLAQCVVKDKSGSELSSVVYDYHKNELSNQTLYLRNKRTSTTEYYYQNGAVVKKVHKGKDGKISSITHYIRNLNNDVIELRIEDAEGNTKSKSKREYLYDQNGNWIRQYEEREGMIKYIIEREIEYRM